MDHNIFERKAAHDLKLFQNLSNIQMGVNALFDPHRADLSGLLNTSMPLHVDKIIHKTIIEINEDFTGNGTDTRKYYFNLFDDYRHSFLLFLKGRHIRKQIGHLGLKDVMVDHPFMYHIWDRESKTTIFSGRIIRPNEQDFPWLFPSREKQLE